MDAGWLSFAITVISERALCLQVCKNYFWTNSPKWRELATLIIMTDGNGHWHSSACFYKWSWSLDWSMNIGESSRIQAVNWVTSETLTLLSYTWSTISRIRPRMNWNWPLDWSMRNSARVDSSSAGNAQLLNDMYEKASEKDLIIRSASLRGEVTTRSNQINFWLILANFFTWWNLNHLDRLTKWKKTFSLTTSLWGAIN